MPNLYGLTYAQPPLYCRAPNPLPLIQNAVQQLGVLVHGSFSLRGTFVSSLLLLSLATSPARAAAPLFPEPLHLTRVVETPFAERTTVDEYLIGNRVITVSADHTVIVDYDQQTVTEIHRRAGTYSITRFDNLARAAQASRRGLSAAAAPKSSANDWDVRDSIRPTGRDRGDYTVARPSKPSPIVEVQVGVDPTILLSREAVEVLLGATYPQNESIESAVAMRAVSRRGGAERRVQTQAAGAAEMLALPIEQSVTYAAGDGEGVVVRNRVTRIGRELPPPEAMAIPAGAKLIASPAVETQRRLEELEQPALPQR